MSPENNQDPAKLYAKAARLSALVGILSLAPAVITGLFGIAAVLSGRAALRHSREVPSGKKPKTMAQIGMAAGFLGIGINIFTAWSIWHAANQWKLEMKCGSNLKQVALAMILWEGDHDDRLPNSFLDLTNYLDSTNSIMLTCPSDSKRLKLRAKTRNLWDPALFSYEFLLPGRKESETTNQIMLRCPIHGWYVLGDGSLHHTGEPKRP